MIEKNATFYKTDEIHGKVFTDILIIQLSDYGHKSQTITY